ncbi:MAG: hypothetical protein K6T83_14415, partial [Alicyclobacillus sp.]|nr:hypothetical protein [Alicyclobacillus sp.]
MRPDEPEYKVLTIIWEIHRRVPRKYQYRALAKQDSSVPSEPDLVQKYGSFDHAVSAFLATYHAIHGYRQIPDYLLGALVSRAQVVRDKRDRMYLRFISSDTEQIEIIRSF